MSNDELHPHAPAYDACPGYHATDQAMDANMRRRITCEDNKVIGNCSSQGTTEFPAFDIMVALFHADSSGAPDLDIVILSDEACLRVLLGLRSWN